MAVRDDDVGSHPKSGSISAYTAVSGAVDPWCHGTVESSGQPFRTVGVIGKLRPVVIDTPETEAPRTGGAAYGEQASRLPVPLHAQGLPGLTSTPLFSVSSTNPRSSPSAEQPARTPPRRGRPRLSSRGTPRIPLVQRQPQVEDPGVVAVIVANRRPAPAAVLRFPETPDMFEVL